MTALETMELVGFAATLLFGLAALWQTRGDTTDFARRKRRRILGILLGVSLLPAEVFLEHRLSIGPWALLVVGLAGGSVVLISRS